MRQLSGCLSLTRTLSAWRSRFVSAARQDPDQTGSARPWEMSHPLLLAAAAGRSSTFSCRKYSTWRFFFASFWGWMMFFLCMKLNGKHGHVSEGMWSNSLYTHRLVYICSLTFLDVALCQAESCWTPLSNMVMGPGVFFNPLLLSLLFIRLGLLFFYYYFPRRDIFFFSTLGWGEYIYGGSDRRGVDYVSLWARRDLPPFSLLSLLAAASHRSLIRWRNIDKYRAQSRSLGNIVCHSLSFTFIAASISFLSEIELKFVFKFKSSGFYQWYNDLDMMGLPCRATIVLLWKRTSFKTELGNEIRKSLYSSSTSGNEGSKQFVGMFRPSFFPLILLQNCKIQLLNHLKLATSCSGKSSLLNEWQMNCRNKWWNKRNSSARIK